MNISITGKILIINNWKDFNKAVWVSGEHVE